MALVMLEGRRWSQLADGGRVIHRSRPTFSNARGESLIGSASMTVWVQKQSIAADRNLASESLENGIDSEITTDAQYSIYSPSPAGH